MSELKQLQEQVLKFRDERDWAQFHNSKDLAMNLSIEAGELMELFLWKTAAEADVSKISDELDDVLMSVLLIAKNHEIDLAKALVDKLERTAKKYPVERSRGKNQKYTEL
ncbi:MAG: nucleotide pyrophosphohydrolase [Pseudomonadota bacterium]